MSLLVRGTSNNSDTTTGYIFSFCMLLPVLTYGRFNFLLDEGSKHKKPTERSQLLRFLEAAGSGLS